MELQEKDKYWLSGLFEGEATFFAQTEKYPLGLCIQMTDEDIIKKVCEIIGTKYYMPTKPKEHYKQTYKTNLRGKPALNIMLQILPLMGERRSKKIKECVASHLEKPRGKISIEQRKDIINLRKKGVQIMELAEKFNISKWRIYQILRA